MSIGTHVETLAGQSREAEPDALVEFMVGYQAGDEECFDRLYDQLVSPLRGYLISLTRNADLAGDLLQETFLQLHRSRRTYRPPGSVKAWAFGIARNVYLMSLRSKARRREVQLPEELAAALSVPSEAGRVVDAELLGRAMAELSPEHREALVLHHLWGFSFAEIAGIVGVSRGAAKVRAHRAVKKLRGAIESKTARPEA